ncbi:MAG: type II toxin-antitoxin system RelE/ParE family toxin [Bdellovibrionales bacterium]
MPHACPLMPRYKSKGIRRCVYRNYLIFYRVYETRIEIVHILQGARDYESLLSDTSL